MFRIVPYIILFLFCFLLPAVLSAEQTDPPDTFPTIDQLAETDLHYKIAFLWMSHIADGSFSLDRGEEPNTYKARLRGKTKGIAAWLTSRRIQTYETLMYKQEQGRLITLTHDSTIEKGRGKTKKIRTKHYVFDPVKSTITVSKIANGALWWEKNLPFSGAMPVDILTAYFNLVTGVYGPIEPGATYSIPAFGGKGVGQINIEVLNDEQRPGTSFFPKGGTLCRFKVDKEIFDTSDGTILVWYDQAGNPARGVIKDIVGLGDIRGRLR
jgi:hypothetical protein